MNKKIISILIIVNFIIKPLFCKISQEQILEFEENLLNRMQEYLNVSESPQIKEEEANKSCVYALNQYLNYIYSPAQQSMWS